MGVEPVSSRSDMKSLTGEEIRTAFLNFYQKRGHLIMPSASLVPDDPTVLLTIAGMLPFKPVFLGHEARPAERVTTSQKCIRTNDIENVGRTARHHTFFEMLGNFSFGDYFKKEAIQWAWELSTQVYSLDPKNIVVSIFREDDEAEAIWKDVVGVEPQRIVRMDEADNFWSSGPTGPCGPCSELYYDFHPECGDTKINLEDDERFIEFYNLVFMEYNRDSEGNLTSLSHCNIDTGMGLERMAQILQRVPNNYETDLIFPLLEKVASLIGVSYKDIEEQGQVSLKVIGDHTRACVQLISDGVTASNLGRGYILRRLLRRVIRHGRLIGITKPFVVQIAEVAIKLMQDAYPLVKERSELIFTEIQREEIRFLETLDRGEKLLTEMLRKKPTQISGEQAFELYDTYGFPMELTQEIAQENSLTVDVKGFEKAMDQQRLRAKAANTIIDLTLQDSIEKLVAELGATNFQGYQKLEQISKVEAMLTNGQFSDNCSIGDRVDLCLDITPFYGEGGGQIGDRGNLVATDSDCFIQIDDVRRIKDAFIHSGIVKSGSLQVGDVVQSQVDRFSRQCAQGNHTATHLLQAALKQLIDPDIRQAGSLVSIDRLRFDFHSPRSITVPELEKIEQLINSWIAEGHSLVVRQMNIDDAKTAGAVAMFGEKYDEIVRVVDVPGVSMELCGGTHVANTSELGVFKIMSETGIAAGIRRIEAIAGQSVLPYLNERDQVVKSLSERLKAQSNEIVDRVITLQNEVKSLNKSLVKVHGELASTKALSLLSKIVKVGSSEFIAERLDALSGESLQSAAKTLVDKLGPNSAVLLAGIPDLNNETKIIFVVVFGSEVIANGLHAGQFVGSIAKICGGGGGGRPNYAQAGGRDPQKIDSAINFAKDELRKSFS